jgi:peptide/nickel transport system permease protein
MQPTAAQPVPSVTRLAQPLVVLHASARALRNHPFEAVGVLVAAIAVFVAVVGPFVAPYEPFLANFPERLQPPSGEHWLGTDPLGRDILSRVFNGARLTLVASLVVIAFAITVGIVVGTLAAVTTWWIDEILMRITDVALSLPALILALGFAASLGRGLQAAVVALAISWWPGYARLVRALVLEVREREFVEAARGLGASRPRVVLRHILPNSLDTLLVQSTLDVANVTLTLAGLSFIGVGALPPEAEWGAMIAEGRTYIFSAWWVVLFPGLALALTAGGFFLLGDLLRAELDPRLSLREVSLASAEATAPVESAA